LNDKAKTILEKYKDCKGKQLLPFISEQKHPDEYFNHRYWLFIKKPLALLLFNRYNYVRTISFYAHSSGRSHIETNTPKEKYFAKRDCEKIG